jgi:polar amino acid transport system permease protein
MESFMIFLQRVGPDFIRGTGVTLQMTLISLALGVIIGLPVGGMRVYGNKWLSRLMQAYIAIFRGTPLLIQLFVVYYGLPDVGVTFSRMAAAFITLGLNSGAYQAEYLRGALQAVGEGQMTAARAIGMSQFKAIRHIVFPQALRLVIPAWSNEMISMIKYTSVVFLIAVPDLMGQAKILAGRYYNPIEIYLAVAVVYLVLVAIASLLLGHFERRLRIPGLQMDV